MSKTARIVLFAISLSLVLLIFFVTTGRLFPADAPSVVLITALIMVSFVSLFLEHFFTRPTDVLASTIAILLLLAPVSKDLSKMGMWYWLFFGYNASLLVLALAALLLLDQSKSAATLQNRASEMLKRFVVFFGNGRFLFFSLFFLALLFYVDSQSWQFLLLGAYSAVVLLLDPREFVLLSWRSKRPGGLDIGTIFSVQSSNTFLAKLYPLTSVPKFAIVEFLHAPNQIEQKGIVGRVFLLDRERWAQVVAPEEIQESLSGVSTTPNKSSNVIYQIQQAAKPPILERFVGLVLEHSDIMKIRFDYGGPKPVFEGSLLQIRISGHQILYQVTQGVTNVEALEQKNEAGMIVGEAVQLGKWDSQRLAFEKYGWVPEVNTPIFLAAPAPAYQPEQGEKQIGSIPGSNYPIVLNLRNAVTHHTAILGVTGSGKSVFCRDLIRKIIADGTKVICVDFTNEYRNKFPDLNPTNIVSDPQKATLFTAIDTLSTELEKFPNQQNKQLIATQNQLLLDGFYAAVRDFLQSERRLALFELPDVANTTGILEYTKWFFRGLFKAARQDGNFGQRVCVVLEEAHTVIPEWNFIGVDDKKASSVVNSISQIALQGRKYNVGFVIVAQRTANVSKTVLTQCNTIVAFQQFDRTSSEFLENYMGSDMVAALPALRFRQAVAVGKAFRSGVPAIFEVPEIVEPVPGALPPAQP